MVTVFSGEVNRTWRFADESGVSHEISLYHHPLTGARAAMVDHDELLGSLGTTSVFHGSTTSIPFAAGSARGTVNIQRGGLLGFAYTCVVDGRSVPEATALLVGGGGQSRLPVDPAAGLNARVVSCATTRDHSQQAAITWYLVETTLGNGREGPTTRVHRRFRDFVDLDEAIQAALAGHHMRSSVPALPEKRFKLTTNHSAGDFVERRRGELDDYLSRLCNVPHVWSTPSAAPFVGVAANVREYSLAFPELLLGFTIGKCTPKSSLYGQEPADFPAFVALCKGAWCPCEVRVGDILSKISGKSTSNMSFAEVIASIKHSQRPIMLHFLATLGDAPAFADAAAAKRADEEDETASGQAQWSE